jgi:hypothetical protein
MDAQHPFFTSHQIGSGSAVVEAELTRTFLLGII